jgi:hypothetical protein
MENQVKIGSPYVNAAALFSVATAVLYLYGNAFRNGYLNEFALNQYLFAESFEQTIITGFRIVLRAPLIYVLAVFGISCAFLVASWAMGKIRNSFKKLIFVVFSILGIALITGVFCLLFNFAYSKGEDIAIQGKRQMDAEPNLKGERGKLTKAIILYDGHENGRPRQLTGYIIANSVNGFAIYVEGKVNFIPMTRIIQISFPVK